MDIVATLISILGMMGLTELQTTIKEKRASVEGVSEDDIIKVINTINNNTRNVNDKTLSNIVSQLNSITFPAGMSDRTKEYIYSARNRLSKEQRSLSNKINEIERNVNSIDERARVYMSMDPNTRIANKSTLIGLVNDAAKENERAGGDVKTSQDVSNMTQRIEKSMTKDKGSVFDKLTEPLKDLKGGSI